MQTHILMHNQHVACIGPDAVVRARRAFGTGTLACQPSRPHALLKPQVSSKLRPAGTDARLET